MAAIVLDASVALEVLIRTTRGVRFASDVFGRERHVPHLLDIEFAQALRRLLLAREISSDRAGLALEALGDWSLARHSHVPFLSRIWELRDSMSAYDAAYVALAEALDVPLLTCDAKLARSHGHRAKILLLT